MITLFVLHRNRTQSDAYKQFINILEYMNCALITGVFPRRHFFLMMSMMVASMEQIVQDSMSVLKIGRLDF